VKTSLIVTLALLIAPAAFAAGSPAVLTASATSSAPGSPPVTCLLDPACQGVWTPGSADYGVDEGIFIQFEQPVAASSVEIILPTPNAAESYALKVYVNGKTKDAQGKYYAALKDEQTAGLFKILRQDRPYAEPAGPLQEPIKSLFLKIDLAPTGSAEKIKIQKIRFLQNGQPVALTLPVLQPAQVSATSVLEPQTAYHPAHLFDAKTDFAWATDGKKNDGKGESAKIHFAAPQNIAGMIVWNGYQRSDMHFHANSRVLKLDVASQGATGQAIALTDTMGPQRVNFATPLTNVSDLTLTIKDIAAGTKYKDTLISELRFITPQGQIILPDADLPKPAAPAAWMPLIDRSYSSFLFQPAACQDCQNEDFGVDFPRQRLRLRSDGSFVIYKSVDVQTADSNVNQTADVLEGNWEPVPAGIRIFGKKYPTVIAASEYLKETAPTNDAAIFQSELHLKNYAELSAGERQSLFDQLWAAKRGPASKGAARWGYCSLAGMKEGAPQKVFGKTATAVFQAWDQFLQSQNPIVLLSTMLTDVLLPSEKVTYCEMGP